MENLQIRAGAMMNVYLAKIISQKDVLIYVKSNWFQNAVLQLWS